MDLHLVYVLLNDLSIVLRKNSPYLRVARGFAPRTNSVSTSLRIALLSADNFVTILISKSLLGFSGGKKIRSDSPDLSNVNVASLTATFCIMLPQRKLFFFNPRIPS